jgi:hypothetical protein
MERKSIIAWCGIMGVFIMSLLVAYQIGKVEGKVEGNLDKDLAVTEAGWTGYQQGFKKCAGFR